MSETVIEVDGLRRAHGRVEAVRGVSLTVRRGELLALLGTNGAGKTTTIEVLEGLHAPTAGRVRVLGLDPVRDRSSVRPRTGMMLQRGGFVGALTVRETVELWRALTPTPRATAELLDIVDLAAVAQVSVEHLSGGERRRLELALAILGRPELVFLDEPTSGMDPASRRRTWEVVRGIVLGLPVPADPLLIVVALALAAAVLAVSAAALSAVTRSSESAMLTSLPTVVIFLAAPGALVPLGTTSERVEEIARYERGDRPARPGRRRVPHRRGPHRRRYGAASR